MMHLAVASEKPIKTKKGLKGCWAYILKQHVDQCERFETYLLIPMIKSISLKVVSEGDVQNYISHERGIISTWKQSHTVPPLTYPALFSERAGSVQQIFMKLQEYGQMWSGYHPYALTSILSTNLGL